MVEWVKFSAYGIPFGLPKGDTDSDGDLDSSDIITIQIWLGGIYDVRGDLNLDGLVDLADYAAASTASPITLGWGALSDVGNRKGYAGYELEVALTNGARFYHVRRRVLHADLGRWLTRDPLGYIDGANLYEYGPSNPLVGTDPSGSKWVPGGLGSSGGTSPIVTGRNRRVRRGPPTVLPPPPRIIRCGWGTSEPGSPVWALASGTPPEPGSEPGSGCGGKGKPLPCDGDDFDVDPDADICKESARLAKLYAKWCGRKQDRAWKECQVECELAHRSRSPISKCGALLYPRESKFRYCTRCAEDGNLPECENWIDAKKCCAKVRKSNTMAALECGAKSVTRKGAIYNFCSGLWRWLTS